jgi:polysaccharide export outer membrane protein
MPSPFRPSPGPAKAPTKNDLAQAFDIVCRNYRVGPADVLRINYQTEWSVPVGSFKLDNLDEIRVEFLADPSLNRTVTVRPDGMITLPGVGDVQALGRSPEDLGRAIAEKYQRSRILRGMIGEGKDGESVDYRLVTVTVTQFYQKVKKMVESLTTLTGGQQLEVTVKPDGAIDLPLMSNRIVAVGKTVAQVEREVNWNYRRESLKNVVASIALTQARSRKVYVVGQVRNPGAYDLPQPITPIQALALAGGHIPESADLTSVILVSKSIDGKPIGRRLDLKKMLDDGDMSSAILIKPYDVIFVPKTYIADVRAFMDQYFRTILDISQFLVERATIRAL